MSVQSVDTRITNAKPVCPLCEGSRYIKYADVYTLLPSKEKYVSWETGMEIRCGCTYLVPIRGVNK